MLTGKPREVFHDADYTGDLGDQRVVDLLHIHLTTFPPGPPESGHALDIAGLQSSEVSFWTIWDDETLLDSVR